MKDAEALPTIGVVVLSMGNRPVELAKALETLHTQSGVQLDTVLVGNGWAPEGVPDWVRTHHLVENVGIPEGRNIGAALTTGELIFFYDDDAFLPREDVLSRMAAVFADERVAVCQPRGVDPDGLTPPRRWTPRLRTGDGGSGGRVAVFWEALCMIRRSAFDEVGGWPGHFWYGHEGIDLAMRLLDADWSLVYAKQIEACHPATQATRHAVFYRMNARNRVWVARRNLPWPLVPVYCGVWLGAALVRTRNLANLRIWLRGFAEGWRTDSGPRHPMRWRTVAEMARLGRVPIF